MFNIVKISAVISFAFVLAACSIESGSNKVPDRNVISAVVIGSAESPDPILQRVMELEKEGKISDVIVMGSFPVQIRMVAPKYIIEELNAMDRKTLPGLLE